VLDIGAYGVVVPSVSSREEAERAVKACRYPQKGGVRGLGPRRASEYYLDNDYFKVVDDEILIAIQIETEEAVRNLREIFSVDGLDVAIVGHWDLSMSMGIFKQFDHPRMKEAIQSVLDEARRAGIAPGIASSADEINDNIARGFIFNSLSSDTEILIQGYIQAIRKIQGWEPHPLAHVIGS
jgi:2-keto-3-deoxy-L-rhamnonate aldolase RhmA